jgi:hypothetical protein
MLQKHTALVEDLMLQRIDSAPPSPNQERPDWPSTEQAEKRKQKTAIVNRLLRWRFTDLWQARHGGCSFINADEEGCLMIMTLLRFGTTDDSIKESAPWLTDDRKIAALRRGGHEIPWREFGKRHKLTYADCERHGLWYWLPIDKTPKEFAELKRERKKNVAAERQRKQRDKKKALREMIDNSDSRRAAIIRILAGEMADAYAARSNAEGWTTASAMVERTATVRAFCRPDGRPLRNRRSAVHRTFQELKADGEIETKTVKGARGDECLVRLADGMVMAKEGGQRDAFCDGRSVARPTEVESVDRPRTSAEKSASDTPSRSVTVPSVTPGAFPAHPRTLAEASSHPADTESVPNGHGKSNGQADQRRERTASKKQTKATEREHVALWVFTSMISETRH